MNGARSQGSWIVAPLRSRARIRRFLDADRFMAAYVLGDLAEPHWSRSAFLGASPRAAPEHLAALALRYEGFDPPILVPFGEPEAVAAILSAMTGVEVYWNASDDLLPIIQRFYDTPAPEAMWRMALKGELAAPAGLERAGRAESLRGPEGARLVAELFAAAGDNAGHRFAPSQIEDGAFFGLFEHGELIAISGTHLVSETESVAAIGNVYTRPGHRRRGLAQAATAATVRCLGERGIRTIVLNVGRENHAAVHVYERLGFERHGPFWEGPGIRRR